MNPTEVEFLRTYEPVVGGRIQHLEYSRLGVAEIVFSKCVFFQAEWPSADDVDASAHPSTAHRTTTVAVVSPAAGDGGSALHPAWGWKPGLFLG